MQNNKIELIKVENMSKSINGNTIIKNANFSIYKGEMIAIIGKSGSGKSTLISILSGLDKPSEGNVYIQGENLYEKNERELSKFRNSKIGIIFQNYNLLNELTCIENIEVPIIFSEKGSFDDKEKEKILELLDLTEKKDLYPKQLSGGEQQRTAIGRAMINKPSIIFADEPTGALDSINGERIISILKNLVLEMDTTVILVTHDLDIANQCDRKILIKDGEIYEDK